MPDWTSGYVADIGYTFGYYNELNPNRSSLALLNAGFAPSSSGIHCELGFGQGLSVNVHAAASASTWYATDFNPSQAAYAKALALESGAQAHLFDQSFEEFCNRADLPEFDSIGLHGIWSWISDENRNTIVDFIRRKLKVGGVLYISYNTLPGWSTFAPMRHLMSEHASVMGSVGSGVVNKVEGALKFAQKLIESNPLYTKANPSVVERFKLIAGQNRHYLAHEYFNKDWHPMHFASASQLLSSAKIGFACSAHYLDHIDVVNLTAEQQALLKEIVDPSFKESVRDFMVNQIFRRDYWIKGGRQLSSPQQFEHIKKQNLVLLHPAEAIALKVTGSLCEANLSEAIYVPILELMSDHKARSIEEISSTLKDKSLNVAQVMQAAMVLAGSGQMESAQNQEQISKAKLTAKKLNNALLDRARFNSEVSYLASPVTGGGIAMNRFEQLFLLSIQKGQALPIEWAQSAWEILSSQDQRIVKEGKPIELAQDNLAELVCQAKEFEHKRLPILKALEIA